MENNSCYSVTFTFIDDKVAKALVDKSSLKDFLKALNNHEVYWDKNGGFWLAFSQVRYLTIQEFKEEPKEEFHDPIAY